MEWGTDSTEEVGWERAEIRLEKIRSQTDSHWGCSFFLTWASLNSAGLMERLTDKQPPQVLEITSETPDAPEYRMADEPGEIQWQ